MPSTDTKQAILQAIIDEPDEDLHRLAYADLLEETGDQSDLNRAEFIRLSLDTHNHLHNHKDWVHGECCPATCRRCEIECKRASLWELHHEANDELGIVKTPWWPKRDNGFASITGLPKRDVINFDYGMWFSCHRGMVDAVACNQRRWKKHGPRLVKEHPIAYVQLQGRHPGTSEPNKDRWWIKSKFDQKSAVYPEFFAFLPKENLEQGTLFWYTATLDNALDCLSDAALLWAKSQ